MINTEHHVDHIFGNYFFTGAGQVVHHQGVYDNFMTVYPELDPFVYAAEAIPVDDPDGTALFPDRHEYYRNPNKGTIVRVDSSEMRAWGGSLTHEGMRALGAPAAPAPAGRLGPDDGTDDGATAGGHEDERDPVQAR